MAPLVTVITDVVRIQRVFGFDSEHTEHLSKVSPDCEIVGKVDAALIKQGMMIGAKAEQVIWRVWTVVWLAERPDMGSLGDRAAGN